MKMLLEGPPDSNEFCCCEICGKYGLRSEFGASGRFCGLTCVGVYTGRRNKGREMSRHVKAFDGKIIKRKKRKGRKLTVIKQSSMNMVWLWSVFNKLICTVIIPIIFLFLSLIFIFIFISILNYHYYHHHHHYHYYNIISLLPSETNSLNYNNWPDQTKFWCFPNQHTEIF